MTALPRHRHLPKGPKLKRISHQYINRKPEQKSSQQPAPEPKSPAQTPPAQPIQPQVQPQRGSFGVAPAQQPQVQQGPWRPFHQPNVVPGWWMALVFILLAIFAFIFFMNLARVLFPNIGDDWGNGPSGSCPTTCPGGMGVTVAPNCNCPPGTKSFFIIRNPPEMNGYKQCTC